MPLNVNSGLTTATISGNVSSVPAFVAPSATQTPISKGSGQAGATNNVNAYTVTVGKTLYVSSISVSPSGGAANFDVYDATSVTGTPVWSCGSGVYSQTFPIPVKFSTAVYFDPSGAANYIWSFTGYEQ